MTVIFAGFTAAVLTERLGLRCGLAALAGYGLLRHVRLRRLKRCEAIL